MNEPKKEAQATPAAATGTPDYGGFQSSAHALPGAVGVHLWWRKIDDLPTQGERDNCRKVITDDSAAYKSSYRVEGPTISNDGQDADLYVYFRQKPTSSAIALLKGAAASTWLRAGWGGGS